MDDLSPREVGGTSGKYGYASDGTIILEEPHDIVNVENRIRAVILSCRCKGKCSSRRCSCLNRGQHCVDCECNDVLCSNRIEQEEDAPNRANDKCAGVRKETVFPNLPATAATDKVMNIEGEISSGDYDSRSLMPGDIESTTSIHCNDIELQDAISLQ